MNSAELAAHERADLAAATSAADAARRILARRCINIPDYIAEQVADAVLGYSDNRLEVRGTAERWIWQDPDGQAHILQRLRHQLLDTVTSGGYVPTALPTQTCTYTSWRDGGRTVAATEPWDQAEITLTVPVRTPPVDREAAVKAGILGA